MYRTDELLLIEHLTYIPDIPPFFSILTRTRASISNAWTAISLP